MEPFNLQPVTAGVLERKLARAFSLYLQNDLLDYLLTSKE